MGLRYRAAQLPRPIVWLIQLPLPALGAFWCVNDSGLYRLLTTWESGRLGDLGRIVAGAVVLGVCLIPGAILIQAAGALRAADHGWQEAANRSGLASARLAHLPEWVRGHRKRLTALALACFVGVSGLLIAGRGLFAGEHTQIDVAAIERGAVPASRDVEITGRVVSDQAIGFVDPPFVRRRGERKRTKDDYTTLYIPLVSRDWQPGQPVRVYLQIAKPGPGRNTPYSSYPGRLSADSLPRLVVTTMADHGQPVADRYWVLEFRRTAELDRNAGYLMICFGACIGLLTAIWWVIAAALARRAAS